jgi:hypothetical protein
MVSEFVNDTLQNRDTVQEFIREIKPELRKAAMFAVKDYFKE